MTALGNLDDAVYHFRCADPQGTRHAVDAWGSLLWAAQVRQADHWSAEGIAPCAPELSHKKALRLQEGFFAQAWGW